MHKSGKQPSLKVYNVGSVIKRRSKSRKSAGKKRRSSVLKKSRIPSVVVHEAEENIAPLATAESDTTSYEGFEVKLKELIFY